MEKLKNFIIYHVVLHFILLLCELLPNLKVSNIIRGKMASPFFKKCGTNFQMAKGVTINMIRNIEIGDNVYIAHNVWINGTGGLYVMSDVIISPMVIIATTKHKRVNGKVSNIESDIAPITIGEGTWIAGNSVITKGVTIGKGCIVAANSTVTKNIDDNLLVGGSPANTIKKYENKEGVF